MAAGLAGHYGVVVRSRAVGSSSRACVLAQTPSQIASVTTVTVTTMTTVSALGNHVLRISRVVTDIHTFKHLNE